MGGLVYSGIECWTKVGDEITKQTGTMNVPDGATGFRFLE